MSIRMQITPNDVKSQKVVRPGWYPVHIDLVKNELAANKESMNVRVEVTALEGDANGVPVITWFSEKFAQGAIPFVIATGGKVTEEDGVDPDYDFESQIGKKVNAHIVTNRGKTGQEKARNMIDDWAPLKAITSSDAIPASPDFEKV